MSFFVISLDFHSAPMEVRACAAPRDLSIVHKILNPLSEKVWLSTCNRVEIYGTQGPDTSSSPEFILESWMKLCGMNSGHRTAFKILKDRLALEHLFRVTASLESMVVGETQIQGQVKRAYEDAIGNAWVGIELHRIFQKSFKVSKKVRTQTEVGRLAVSIPSIGVKLAEKILGDLGTQSVAVFGLGEIGRNAAEHFASVQPREVQLYNRTESVAISLADRLRSQNVTATVLSNPDQLLENTNILVFAADAPLISLGDMKAKDERGEAFFILDLAVPSQVPSFSLRNGFVFRIDDLQKIAEENMNLRSQELGRAEKMIEDEVNSLEQLLSSKTLDDALRDVSQKTTMIADRELKELRPRLTKISDSDWSEIEKMARRLSSKVLQDPVLELKYRAKQGLEPETILEFFRSLFKI